MTLSRRQFLRRGALLAAGTLAVPGWAQWLGEKMEALRPKPRVFLPDAQACQRKWQIVYQVHDEVVYEGDPDAIQAEIDRIMRYTLASLAAQQGFSFSAVSGTIPERSIKDYAGLLYGVALAG